MNNFWGHHPIPSDVDAGSDRTNDEQETYHQYPHPAPSNINSYYNPRHQQDGSTNTLTNAGWDRPGSSSQMWYSTKPETEEDPDGLPYEPDQEEPDQGDPELIRKRKELQVIEDRIMLKRASLALKTAEVKTSNLGLSTRKSKGKKKKGPLKRRVNLLLLLRDRVLRTNGLLVRSRRHTFHVQQDHPLKQRVAAALQQRLVNPPLEPQIYEPIPFISSPAPHQKDPSPAKEEVNNSDQGFMRFLNILNKGVDIDKLTKIVNDDTGGVPHSSQNGVQIHSETSLSEPPPIERVKLEDEEPQPSTNEQQKHLQYILDSLGLSLGTEEISRLGDRTQERLYGKKQSTQEDKTQTDQPQAEGVEKYSPAHYTRSSSSPESDSGSSRASSRTPSTSWRRRSPSPIRSRRRSSRSPNSRRHLRSPSPRRRDSRSPHRRESPHPRDHQDSHLENVSPVQPYPYPPSQYFTPQYLPQMYPNAHCYSQYTAFSNYWAYNQASIMGLAALSNQNYLQNILPLLSGLQTFPNTSKLQPPTKTVARCLINIESNESNGVVLSRKTMTREQKTQMNRDNKAQRKQRRRGLRRKERENKNWETELKDVIARIKSATDPTGDGTAGSSVAQGTSEAQQNPTDSSGPKKKKKKNNVFIERNEQMEELLKERPGPVTRTLGLKNPARLSELEGQLVEIQDVEVPSQNLEVIPVICSVRRTDIKESEEEAVDVMEAQVEAKLKKFKRARRNAEQKWRKSKQQVDHLLYKDKLRAFKKFMSGVQKRKHIDLLHVPTTDSVKMTEGEESEEEAVEAQHKPRFTETVFKDKLDKWRERELMTADKKSRRKHEDLLHVPTTDLVKRTEGEEADEEQPLAKPELTEAEVKAKLRKEASGVRLPLKTISQIRR